jgi:phosphopantothenoylcysteine decarboxylase/phosphopantothenate--cysteine ligase
MLKDKFVVVGITGSIAAYKAVELVRLLKKNGAQVQVIMTKSACEFINPLTFQVVSQNPVITDMFKPPDKWDVEHIAIAEKADIFIVAPATANIIAKIAAGLADDMLTTTLLATKAKVVIAPAMNVHMYENVVTQRNIKYLSDMGYKIIEPDTGYLACGHTGKGRLPEPKHIMMEIEHMLAAKDLKDKKILITAGPTREHIDPVRFITNHSTGKMGFALAQRAVIRGAKVVLISGPCNLEPPLGLSKFMAVQTAQEMLDCVLENYLDADIVIKAAAVGDFKPKQVFTEKIKKTDDKLILELDRNPDILYELGKRKTHQILIGFAAETQQIEKYATDKLKNKNLDFIVANNITQEGAGFGFDTNIVKIFYRDGKIEELPSMLKKDVADLILDRALSYIP